MLSDFAQFKAMTTALSPTLASFRQKTFYEEPRFHVSFAWALLDRTAFCTQHDGDRSNRSSSPSPASLTPGPHPQTSPEPVPADLPSDGVSASVQFPTIPQFPEDLARALNTEFGKKLVGGRVGVFKATELCVRIGKEVSKWKLGG